MADEPTSQECPGRNSVLHDITHTALPVIFFLHFLITGTVVLIYTLYFHEPIPTNYAVGAAITFGCIIVLLALGHLWLYGRRRRSGRSDVELQSTSGPKRNSERGGIRGWFHRLGCYLVEYEYNQRKHVRGFLEERRERELTKRGFVDGTKRASQVTMQELLLLKIQSSITKLKRQAKRRKAHDNGNMHQTSDKDIELQAGIKIPHIRELPESARPETHYDNPERVGRSAAQRLSWMSELDGSKPILTAPQRAKAKMTDQHAIIEENSSSPARPNRRSSVLPDDILTEVHPAPGDEFSEAKIRPFPPAHVADGRQRSVVGYEFTTQRGRNPRRGRVASVVNNQQEINGHQAPPAVPPKQLSGQTNNVTDMPKDPSHPSSGVRDILASQVSPRTRPVKPFVATSPILSTREASDLGLSGFGNCGVRGRVGGATNMQTTPSYAPYSASQTDSMPQSPNLPQAIAGKMAFEIGQGLLNNVNLEGKVGQDSPDARQRPPAFAIRRKSIDTEHSSKKPASPVQWI